MNIYDRVRVDDRYFATVIAAGDPGRSPGITVKFDREAVARMSPDQARALKRTGGCLFVPNHEAERLTVMA